MNIKGIDILEGLEHANNDEELYQEILQIYYEDSEDMLNQLRNNIQRTDMKLFITQAHAMKSSSRNIGAVELSEQFKEMEFAGKDNDMDKIEAKLPACLDALEEMRNNLKEYLENGGSDDDEKPDALFMRKMQSALDDMDTDAFDELLELALSKEYREDVVQQFRKVQEAYDDFDFSKVTDLLEELLQ